MTERCILFADVVGSTALYEKLGDSEAKHAVERCLKRVQLAVGHFGGRVIKNIGDGILADFADAAATMAAACEMQQRVNDLPPVAGQSLRLRIGFHTGPVIEEAGDIFGDAVNLASRLADLARAEQIISSASTIAALPALQRLSVRALPALPIKGKSEPVALCEVFWRSDAENGELTLVAGHSPNAPSGRRLLLACDQARVELEALAAPLMIGRDKSCDLVVADAMASRQHARIERSGDHFMLIDQSTNGTWLGREGEAQTVLRREALPLVGRGRISLGHPVTEDARAGHAGSAAPVITYSAE